MQSAHMSEESSIPSRLKAIREQAGVSVREMARRIGMSSGGYTHYENPTRFKGEYLPLQVAKAFAKALKDEGYSGEIMSLSVDPVLFTGSENLPSLAENPPKVFGEFLHGMVSSADHSGPMLVPVYDVAASAGYGAIVDYESIAYSVAFPPEYLRRLTKADPRHLSIISVKGDSMEPTLKDDDIVMLDASKTNLAFDGMFVLRYDEALHVKRVGRSSRQGFVTILSDNRQTYPAFEIAAEDLTVVGKVIWYGRKV